MSYTITTTSGATLATIADGTINDSATSLTLIGKNYAGYGVFINDNYIKLLENFSNDVPPASVLPGQLWYDSRNKILKVYDSTTWKPISSSTSGTNQPTGPIPGDIWWDTANVQLKVWSGSAWIAIGPFVSSVSGTSGAITETILDTSNNSHAVIRFYVSNTTVAILSKDATFSPSPAIAGFATIKPGINLATTDVISNSQFTGNAENAIRLNGIAGSSYILNTGAVSLDYAITATEYNVKSNLNIGSSGTTSIIKNLQSNGDLDLYVKRSGTDTKAIGITGTTANVVLAANLAVNGGSITTSAATATLFNSTTAINIGATTGTATIRNATTAITGNATVGGTLAVTGAATLSNDLAVNGGDITTSSSTFNLINTTATILNIGQAATTISIGATTGTTTIRNNTSISLSLGVGTAVAGATGEIRATNNITAFFSSDKKFKENVEDIDNALSKVEVIGGKTFDWTNEYIAEKGGDDGYFVTKQDFGVIAQDVQSVFPLAVKERPDGSLAVDYVKLCALAFAAIKELSYKVKQLESK